MKKIRVRIFLWLFGMVMHGMPVMGQKPVLTVVDFTEMQLRKSKIDKGEREALDFRRHLIDQAESALEDGPFSVMDKRGVPPSGDKHDYMTMAPYFWPNPETDDGLPYIRKDGEINPQTRDDFTDFTSKKSLFQSLNTLGHAFYYSDELKYAAKAIALVDTWFLDPDTKMNPHLNFGQGIPGLIDGRPFGVIEFGQITELITCLELLEVRKALPTAIKEGIRDWLTAYADWLRTSEIGSMEGSRTNNHGTHYDVQMCSIRLYLGEEQKVRERLKTITKDRIAQQIEPDGRQPRELQRTKSFNYSTMNLEGFMQLARYGNRLGVDLWNHETEDGRSIKRAFEFLIPYLSNKHWEYQELTPRESYLNRFARLLSHAGIEFGEQKYVEIASEFINNQKSLKK